MTLLVHAALLLTLGAAPPAPGEEPGAARAPEIKGADLDLLQEVRRVASRFETLRGSGFRTPPLAVRASADARREVARTRVANVVSADRLAARGRAWADVGLGEPEAPAALYRVLSEDLADVAYDPLRRRLLVDPAILTEDDFSPPPDEEAQDSGAALLLATGVRPDEPSIVHALDHQLVHERSGGGLPETTDALLARAALVEGSANVAAIRYLFLSMGLEDEVLRRGLDPGSVLDGALIPASLESLGEPVRSLVDWVYRDGFALAATRYGAGGWDALDEALRGGWATRDLLHPDRPRPTGAGIAPPDPGLPESFSRVDSDALGEQAIVVLVSRWTGKANLGMLAGDGWVADRLFRWEDGAGAGATIWITRWVSAEEAEDFEYAFSRAVDARFPEAASEAAGEGRNRRVAGGRIIEIARQGSEVRFDSRPIRLEE